MASAEPSAVTILYAEEDTDWCHYVLEQFRSDKLQFKIKSINVTDSDRENQSVSEMKTAIMESYAVVLLTTCSFMDYMKSQRRTFAPVLQIMNTSITAIVAATIDVPTERLQEMADACKYDRDQWAIIDIDVSGNNIKECISQILDIADTIAETQAKRSSVSDMTDVSNTSSSGIKEQVEIIPRMINEEGEKVALIFSKEKVEGSITVHSGGNQFPVETVNPFCVTFSAPEIIGTKVIMQVDVNNIRVRRFKLYSRQSPQFPSLEFLCQIYGTNSKDELDQMLADKFISSMCTDGQAMMLINKLMDNVSRGPQNSQYPTLLHWAAANGLKDFCSALMSSFGAQEACHIQNCDGDNAAYLAEKNNHHDLSDFITKFTETKEMVQACDMYVQSMRRPSKSLGSYINNEAVHDSRSGKQPDPPKAHKILLPPGSPSDLPPPLKCPSGEDSHYILPESLLTKEASNEFIEIQEVLKNGNFSIKNAEMLSGSWRAQYETGKGISFADRQKSIQAIREQNKKALEVLLKTVKPMKSSEGKKKDEKESTGLRKKLGNLWRSKDSGLSTKMTMRDSGISNARDSTLSQTSTSSEEAENDDMPPFYQIRTSQTDRPAGRAADNRKSMREEYLLLSKELSSVSESSPPPLPPRRKNSRQ